MLKKLLKGCLTVAMVSAFAASASADATFKWTGNVSASFGQGSEKVGSGDAVSAMDIKTTADLDLSVKIPGDAWSGEAKIELDYTDAQGTSKVDDMYVVMYNDAMQVWLGDFDPIGLAMGTAYVGDLYLAGQGVWGEEVGEAGYAMVKMNDLGVAGVLGFNVADDASGNTYNETTFGVTYSKSFGDIDFAFQYFSKSTAYAVSNTKGVYDGYAGTDMLLGVGYNMGKMTFGLNYEAWTNKDGKKAETTNSITELVFDMGLDETSGISFIYDMKAEDDKTTKTDTSIMEITYKKSTGPVDHYVFYGTSSKEVKSTPSVKTDESLLGYTMKVGF